MVSYEEWRRTSSSAWSTCRSVSRCNVCASIHGIGREVPCRSVQYIVGQQPGVADGRVGKTVTTERTVQAAELVLRKSLLDRIAHQHCTQC